MLAGSLRRGAGILPALLVLLLIASCRTLPSPVPSGQIAPPAPTFAVYYGERPRLAALARYDWAIVPDDMALPSRGKTVFFAYLSVGEIDAGGPIARALSALPGGVASVSLGRNAFWHSTVADVRKETLRQVLLDRVVRDVSRGFGGLFLDTLDSPLAYRESHPRRGQGIRKALVSLVTLIHASYPGLRIIANRGFGILPGIAPDLSGILYEDFCSRYDERTRRYVAVPERDRALFLPEIARARKINPSISILALDYEDPAHPVFQRRCRSLARSLGFSHFTSDIALDRVGRSEEGQ